MTEPVTNEELAPWLEIIKKMDGPPGTTVKNTPLYILKTIIARLNAAEEERDRLAEELATHSPGHNQFPGPETRRAR